MPNLRKLVYQTGPAYADQSRFSAYSYEFLIFGVKQAWACLFAGVLLALILLTKIWYPFDNLLRYDFLFMAAVLTQILLLLYRLESLQEAKIILLFHIIATLMELYKTSDAIGSWVYPEASVFYLFNVPLFAGFMYSAVGSYLARVWNGFHFRFSNYPSVWLTIMVSVLIYANFFTHHFIYDFRWLLFALVGAMFWRTRIYFTVLHQERWMPLLLGLFLVATFIWFAENISTFATIWQYPNQQNGWKMVSYNKLGAWYLLMVISFVMVSMLHLKDLNRKS